MKKIRKIRILDLCLQCSPDFKLDLRGLYFYRRDQGIEQGLTSHQTHYIGHIRDGFLQVKWLNQQCQSTEGRERGEVRERRGRVWNGTERGKGRSGVERKGEG